MTKFVKGKEKFAYGFAAVGSYMVANIVSSYFLNYVTDILIIKAWWFTIMLMLVGRITDMITDPLMGIIVDKTRSSAGKMRPYVRIGAFFHWDSRNSYVLPAVGRRTRENGLRHDYVRGLRTCIYAG